MTNFTKINSKSITSIVLTSIIGLVFIISGISKLFVFKSFVMTVAKFLPFLMQHSTYIAGTVIFLEISLGLLMLIRYRLLFASAALSILLTFFIGLLMYEAITGNSIRCNCFGGLNISFPNKVQILIDLVLLNGLILINFLHAKTPLILEKRKQYSWVIPSVIIIFVEFALIKSVWIDRPGKNIEDTSQILSFVSARNVALLSKKQAKSAIFLISFYDFNCPLCYDDFLALSDSIQKSTKNINVVYLFEKKSLLAESLDSTRLETWKKVNNINSPAFLVKDKFFEDNSIKKSSIIILDDKKGLFVKGEFPIGEEKRHHILTFLSN